MSAHPPDLAGEFGQIDIYLFDQILRGRVTPRDRVFDAGCGMGRNLVYLLKAGCDVAAVDGDPDAVAAVRDLASSLRPDLPADRFRVEPLEAITMPPGWADVVLCSAVLHFARDESQFAAMLQGCWRVVRPGGMFFCRLASSIGMEARLAPEARGEGAAGSRTTGRFRLPDGTRRFLVDEPTLMRWTSELGGDLLDPLKTTVVQDQRAMTTWVVRKR